ncbi:hypothetical protein CAOG_00904 [Capsaspora owczarzaki ATCC 30864]|uniref:Polysaccharide biosynthesis domain-containing protein n=1 Tax=Capsaspora owczarzaki (strain ATCC 30864) TaxID=595528 RepID=A0A0D2VHK9_CAPO3|nr:hypothetical protein CAOG_00904 [Capsaspora owczarzaki ATCC 30864]KJE89437.1 hypothetical protein CAOG_000904 [Capsaspora owczarzaki ATCC 30864]|eukprot:XP_004365775.1 hypothetical protein CAOG_00904 [Capsaspora owczarzaki ATCC 30864]
MSFLKQVEDVLEAPGFVPRAGEAAEPGSVFDATKYVNQQDLEHMWATKAFQHAEVYYKLISSFPDPSKLKLTPLDNEIYSHFRDLFPDFPVGLVRESLLKTEESKEKWRPFCNAYDKRIDDHNFGTLLRLDATKDYTEDNTIFANRIQFYAIELARNREGHNRNLPKP